MKALGMLVLLASLVAFSQAQTCNAGWFWNTAGNFCDNCTVCTTCTGAANNCLTCTSNNEYELTGTSCTQKCPFPQYVDANTQNCAACPNAAGTCNGKCIHQYSDLAGRCLQCFDSNAYLIVNTLQCSTSCNGKSMNISGNLYC